MWYGFLRGLPITVNRQKVIGNYIVDFYCASAKLVIELDGSQHYKDKGPEEDKKRDAYLRDYGITVVRYSNEDIMLRFQNVCEDILRYLDTSPVSACGTATLPSRGGKRSRT